VADPRLDQLVQTANARLMDRAIRHALYLERLKTGEVRKVLDFLQARMYPDVLGQLTRRLELIKVRGFDKGPHTTARLRRMVFAIGQIIDKRMGEARRALNGSLAGIATSEARFQAGLIAGSSTIAFETALPSSTILRSVVTARPFNGKVLREWWGRQALADKLKISDAVSIGISEGEGTGAIVSRVRKGFGGSKHGVEAMVRSSVNHVTTHARDATYRENSDLVKGWRFVATLDTRTTSTCMALDGKVFDLGTGPKPPRHFGCRSTTTPVLKSWKEMGIALPDAPPGTRASLDGGVPATQTYGAWLRGQPLEIQNEALGVRRAQLFRNGLPIERFVDRRGAPLTLKDLERLEADVFAAA